MKLETLATERIWARCPYCDAKTVLFENNANCNGIIVKCTRKCGRTFELVIKDGKQIFPKKK